LSSIQNNLVICHKSKRHFEIGVSPWRSWHLERSGRDEKSFIKTITPFASLAPLATLALNIFNKTSIPIHRDSTNS
jgi:hypothetical protein